MQTMFIDIETIPTQRPEIRERFRGAAAVAHDAKLASIEKQYKKQETIDKHRAELGEADDGDAEWRKTALNGATGEIVCIAWAMEVDPVESVARLPESITEADLLREFFARMPPDTAVILNWVGHNALNFDIRFLMQRCMVCDVKPAITIPINSGDAQRRVYDTMQEWCGRYGNDRFISLDALADALYVPCAKDGVSGADVWGLVEAGEIEKVRKYCESDVETVRGIYDAMNWQRNVTDF